MIIDIGTDNVRVALVSVAGNILTVKRDTVHYKRDDSYPEVLHFDPARLWDQIVSLGREALRQYQNISIQAITASSQREGIVLLDEGGHSLIGLPNHDHRGRQWEEIVRHKDRVYELTGRYPNSLFSALKLKGVEEKRPALWHKVHSFLSISDWAQYKLTGVARYEHSQASETQLYSVKNQKWSSELAANFKLSIDHRPNLIEAGTILGDILQEHADSWGISAETPIVVRGADTQLAIKSTRPAVEDIVIVSGTTTPVTKIMKEYRIDQKQRTWTNRDIETGRFVLETNAGVTGLNYQRLKKIFYPNEDYDTIEKELAQINHSRCFAALGSLISGEESPLLRGGFVFEVPVSHDLSRADFAWAALWDIACSIKENYDVLNEVGEHDSKYVWACSGGMQSATLRM